MLTIAEQKKQAGTAAANLVQSGMIVGLGTGSTVAYTLQRLAERLQSGELVEIAGISTSNDTTAKAQKLGIPLTSFAHHTQIDLTIDGADEVDPALNLIKGAGGALLREKVVAQASQRLIIIVSANKLSPVLGTTWAVPIEVIPFAWQIEADYLRQIGGSPTVRHQKSGEMYYTDQGNLILDTNFGEIADLQTLDQQLNSRAGIMEHGLFLNLATEVIVAENAGIRTITKKVL